MNATGLGSVNPCLQESVRFGNAERLDIESDRTYGSRPPGCLLLALDEEAAIGTAVMRQIRPETAEIKRMWVDPSCGRGGTGRAMLDRVLERASSAGYERVARPTTLAIPADAPANTLDLLSLST